MIIDRPAWDVSTAGTHPALADLTITEEEMERARRNSKRIQAELAEARGAIGGGLGGDLEFVSQQERLAASFAAQLAHWEDESLTVETRSWACGCGARGDEWSALEPATIDVAEARIESKHGEAGCPECGSTELTWTQTENRAERIHAAREGLATALYRLSRFEEALAATVSDVRSARSEVAGPVADIGHRTSNFELLEARIHKMAEAVYRPDEQKCECGQDYQEWDRLFSAAHGRVLAALECPRCGDVNVTPLVDVFQPGQAALR